MGCYPFSSVVHFTIGSQGPYFCQIWDGGEGVPHLGQCDNGLRSFGL